MTWLTNECSSHCSVWRRPVANGITARETLLYTVSWWKTALSWYQHTDQQRDKENHKKWRIHLENAVEGGSCCFGCLHHAWCQLLILCLTKMFPCQFLVQTSQNMNNTRPVTSASDEVKNHQRWSVMIVFRHGLFLFPVACTKRARQEERGQKYSYDRRSAGVAHQNTRLLLLSNERILVIWQTKCWSMSKILEQFQSFTHEQFSPEGLMC